jgi:hypothetical protein
MVAALGIVGASALAAPGSPTKAANGKSAKPAVAANLPASIRQKLVGSQAAKDRAAMVARQLERSHHAFIQNKGQWKSDVSFRAQSEGLDAWLTKSGITFDFFKHAVRNGHKGFAGQVVRMDFVGANENSVATGLGSSKRTQQYLLKKASKPQEAPVFDAALTRDLYQGVDLKTYYSGKQVRYDLIVHPGADPSKVAFTFTGANSVKAKGTKLSLGTQIGTVAQADLFAYQVQNGKEVQIPASFVSKDGKVSFALGAYNHNLPLVIDPVVYGSYFGGNAGWDEVHSIVSDTLGGVYVTGVTQSSDFPVTTGPYFTTIKGTQNGFMTRFEGDAYAVDYSVLFGGSNVDNPEFIQLDPYGNLWILGTTTSPDFPGNTKPSSGTNSDIFLIRFQKNPNTILDPVTNPVTLMIGGASNEVIKGFAIKPIPNPPTTGPVTLLIAGSSTQAVAEVPGTFTAQGGFLLSYVFADGAGFTQNSSQSFYIGDSDSFPVTLSGLATDSTGAAYITGSVGVSGTNIDTSTTSGVFTTTSGVFSGGRLLRGVDLFLRKYGTDGTLIYSALVGGSDDELPGGTDFGPDGLDFTSGSCIAVDSQSSAYIVGVSSSFDYPRTRGSYGETWADGLPHVVVTKISADASAIIYSTNLKDTFSSSGGYSSVLSGGIIPSGIAVDGFGQAYITGNLFPAQLKFPTPAGDPDSPSGYWTGQPIIQTGADGSDAPISTTYQLQATPQIGGFGCYLNVLDPTGSKLVYGTYLGGTIDNKVFGPYVDSYSDVWVFGWTAGVRSYTVQGTKTFSPNPPYLDFSQLPTGLITAKAYKTNDASDGLQLIEWPFWDPNDVVNTGVLPIFESRDGWLAKLRVGRPIVSGVILGQTTVPGGLGAQTTVTVTLSGPAPAQGAQVVLTVSNASVASFSSGSSNGTVTTVIPAGQTTSSAIPIYSLPVPGNTQVLVKATYDGNFLISGLNVVPWIQNLSLNPTAVVGGNKVTGTITLSFPAPAGGVPVSVNSSSSLLSFPTNNLVTVPANQSTTTFTIGTVGVDTVTSVAANASVLAVTKTAALELDPASLLSIVVAPTNVSSLGVLNGTVTLTGLPGGQFPNVTVTVTDTQGNPLGTYTIATNPLNFNGGNTAAFTITTPYEPSQVGRLAVASMNTVTGTGYVNQSISTVFTVDPSALLSLSVDKPTPNPGDTLNATVTLASPADQGGANVTLTSSNPAVIPIPTGTSPISVLAGQTQATAALKVVAVATTQVTPVTLTATRGTVTATTTVMVQPATMTFTVTDANGNPVTTILGGNKVTGTATLSAPAPAGGLTVTLTGTPSGIASTTGTITIPAGQTSASFQISLAQVAQDTSLSLSVAAGGITSNTVNLTVRATGLQSVAFIPASVRGNHVTLGRVVLTGPAPAGGTTITLTSSNSRLFPAAVVVVVPAGQTFATFTLFAPKVSRPLAVTWTATDILNNLASAVLTVLR